MPRRALHRRIDGRAAAATLAIVFAAGGMVASAALQGGWLTNDGYEHLGIAHSWLSGEGFVDPIQWHYYLDVSPPLPATAVRAPVISLLAALPLAAGATIPTVIVVHAIWSAVVVGAIFAVARRFMRRRAAAAVALLVASFPAWNQYLAATPLTEVTATACYLLVLATSGGVLRSKRAALGCAAATLLAALTRPNLSALVIAVGVAAVWEVGVRRGLRERGIWIYALGFAVVFASIAVAVGALTGVGLYAGYGIQTEMLSYQDVWRYDREYVGFWSYASQHAGEIAARIGEHATGLASSLTFGSNFNYVGWLLPFAVGYGLMRPRDGVLFHRINAFSMLGFSFVLSVNYSAYESSRYPLWVAVPICLTGVAWLDDLARRWERSRRADALGAKPRLRDRLRTAPGWIPLAIASAISAATIGIASLDLPAAWRHYQTASSRVLYPAGQADLLAVCAQIDDDAVVASADPWQVYFWCGNAGVRMPIDPTADEIRDRFVDERRVGYILFSRNPQRPALASARWYRSLEGSDAFERVAVSGAVVLYEVVAAPPETRPWKAPPPLVCTGRGAECARRVASGRGASRGPAGAAEVRPR